MNASTIEEFKTSVEFENILSKEFLKDGVKVKTMIESH